MDAVLLELTHDGGTATLRLEPDPRAERRALVHGSGVALSHAGPLAPGPVRELVLELARRFATTDPGSDSGSSIDAAVARLRDLIAALAPGARLILGAPGLRGLPVWPSTLRTGAPPAEGPIWPFDAELAGLRLGRRRLVKREAFTDDAEAADRAWLTAAGVTLIRVGPVEPDGRRVSLGALDPRDLADHVRDAEARLRVGDDAQAIRTLGDALGYPACCVAAFAAAAGRDDRSLVAARLPPAERAPASPLTQWLNQPLALISHVPCGLDCAATTALAADLLDALDGATPGFAARWRALAARHHVIDQRGRGLALRGTGSLATGFRVEHAVAFAVPRRADLSDLACALPDAVGRTLTRADVLASADHRA